MNIINILYLQGYPHTYIRGKPWTTLLVTTIDDWIETNTGLIYAIEISCEGLDNLYREWTGMSNIIQDLNYNIFPTHIETLIGLVKLVVNPAIEDIVIIPEIYI